MSDMISREALVREVLGITIVSPEVMNYANAIAVAIVDAPSVDAEPVRHGRWIDHPDDSCSLFNGWKCSECEQIVSGGRGNYCPNCGAKMDGGAEDA